MALNINGTTGISGVDGSVSAPAVTGTDSNTGITFPSADTIKFATGGVERMAITNSGVTGITAGITMAQLWRINTSFGVAAQHGAIDANWEVADHAGVGSILLNGSGMSQSSGIFSFPSTGIYSIQFVCGYYASATDIRYLGASIYTTQNNGGAYTHAAVNYGHIANMTGGATHTTVVTNTIFDVTDTSTHKCYFALANVSQVSVHRHTDINYTHVIFTRLGDT